MNAHIITQGGKDRLAESKAEVLEDILNPELRDIFLERPGQVSAQFFLYFSPAIVDITLTHDELLFDKVVLTLFFIGERSSSYLNHCEQIR
jgi:hypothetical protein